MKAKRLEEISIERDGITFTGERTIEGTRKLMQEISYNGKTKYDGKVYTPADREWMDIKARLIIGELISESRKPEP